MGPTGDAEHSYLRSVGPYLKDVFLRWQWLVGIVVAAVGYVSLFKAGFGLAPLVWLVVFLMGFMIANFQLYHEHRPPTDAESLGLPMWAMHAASANAEGTWLVLLLYGFLPKEPTTTEFFDKYVEAIAQTFGYESKALGLRPYGSGMEVRFPDGIGTPHFMVQFGGDQYKAIDIAWRTNADPVRLGWVMTNLDRALSFLLTEPSRSIVNDSRLRRCIIALNNWPEKGIDATGLIKPSRRSTQWTKGNAAHDTYTITNKTNPWHVTQKFAALVLGQGGFVGFESDVQGLTRETVENFK